MVMIFRCKTKKKIISLFKRLHKKGYKWNDGSSLLDMEGLNECWKIHKKELLIGIKKNRNIGYGTIKDLKWNKKYLKELYDYNEKTIDKLILIERLKGVTE